LPPLKLRGREWWRDKLSKCLRDTSGCRAAPKNAPRNCLGAPEEGSFGTFRQLDDVVINNGQTA
jgi:hypothetical protein